jgi:c(7)-type cytochrome triheme protein
MLCKRFLIEIAVLTVLLFLLCAASESKGEFYDFPPPRADYEYGSLLINRISEKNNVKPATFSHSLHRTRHTCRICHFELGFKMKVNTTEITEAANKAGGFCGSLGCHDGTAAFGHTEENCSKCHNGDLAYGKEKFEAFREKLPRDDFGNKINWVEALEKKFIKPVHVLAVPLPSDLKFIKRIEFEAWSLIPPAFFSHERHTKWLDCNICHPKIFHMKLNVTDITMDRISKGEFCGACHQSVAFPLQDCQRCHPGMISN